MMHPLVIDAPSPTDTRGPHVKGSVRAMWISDLHLGLSACRADALLGFLKAHPTPLIVMVGDMADLLQMRRGLRWDASYSRLLRYLLKRVEKGVRVVYVPGNHDAQFRDLAGQTVFGIEIAQQAIYRHESGPLLVTHGDEADAVVRISPLLATVGGWGYDVLLEINTLMTGVQRALGRRPWSLAKAVKASVKRACTYISDFEGTIAAQARARGCVGVICGHIHHAEVREVDGVRYYNTGDWVESCTALVEHWDGRLALVHAPAAAAVATISAEVAGIGLLRIEEDEEAELPWPTVLR
jgi:UDP-2,3-diacylglucosamine pyrophosphatase LpxH